MLWLSTLILPALAPALTAAPARGQYLKQHELPEPAWWTYLALSVPPQLRGEDLILPPQLAGARVFYLDEPAMMRQLPKGARADMRRSRSSFRIKADLDRDRRSELYRAGFYRRADGGGGTFLAGFEAGRQIGLLWFDTPDPKAGHQDFSALFRERGSVFWAACLECDNFVRITYDGLTLNSLDEEGEE